MSPRDLEGLGARWMAAMKRGDFEAAWQETDRIEIERRAFEAAGSLTRQPHQLTWNGSPFDGRRVLVRCTHGLGDTLQFVRYVPLVQKRAHSVRLLVQPQLLPLFTNAAEFGDVRSGSTDEPLPFHDVDIEIMELAYAFRSTVATLPNTVPYLPLAPLKSYAERLPPMPAGNAFKVGLLWAASDWDRRRSVSLDLLEALGHVPGVRFYSLQQGSAAADWPKAPFPLEPLHTHTAGVPAAAAAMRTLDLVITVDCMAAHLAGALACPVWVLLQEDADWRWMTHRRDSPWYPTMRLFRQAVRGDWSNVIEKLVVELKEVSRRPIVKAAGALPSR